MKEVLEFATHPVNAIPTTLLVFTLVYWLVVIVGLIDMDTLDVDIDTDVDLDFDVDVDTDVDLTAGKNIDFDTDTELGGKGEGATVSWLSGLLTFFNLGHVPLMLFISFVAMPMWFFSIMTNYYLGNSSFLFSLLLLLPNFIVSLFISKLLTTPFARFFAKVKNNTESVSPVGKVCTVLLSVNHTSTGQAEIKVDGTTLRINARCSEGTSLKKGDTALVIDYMTDKNYYLIEPYKLK